MNRQIFLFSILVCLGCGKQSDNLAELAENQLMDQEFLAAIESSEKALLNAKDVTEKLKLETLKGRCYLELATKAFNSVENEASENYARLAIEQFTKVIETRENHEVYDFRKMAHLLLGNRDAASKDAIKARELDPTYLSAYSNAPPDRISESRRRLIEKMDNMTEAESKVVDFDKKYEKRTPESEDETSTVENEIADTLAPGNIPNSNRFVTSVGDGFGIGRGSVAVPGHNTKQEKGNSGSEHNALRPDKNSLRPHSSPRSDNTGTETTKPNATRPLDIAQPTTPNGPLNQPQLPNSQPTWVPPAYIPRATPTTGFVGQQPKYQNLFPNVPTTGYGMPIVTQPPIGKLPAGANLGSFQPSQMSGLMYTGALPYEQRKKIGVSGSKVTAPYSQPTSIVEPYQAFPKTQLPSIDPSIGVTTLPVPIPPIFKSPN